MDFKTTARFEELQIAMGFSFRSRLLYNGVTYEANLVTGGSGTLQNPDRCPLCSETGPRLLRLFQWYNITM